MRGLALRAGTAFFAVMSGSAAQAQAVAPHLWAVPGLYGVDRSACQQSSSLDTAMVAPLFCPALDAKAREAIGQRFVSAMAGAFPGVEARFAQALPADATPRAKLASTLIASLRMTRATVWRVDKAVGVDAFLPITLTLDVTNAATGEVVFTRTRTTVSQGTYPSAGIEAALFAQFPSALDAAMQALVRDAAAQWHPYSQAATVVGKVDAGWVVNRGRIHGLRAGDAVGEDGTILYSGAGYAVVKPVLGDYRMGQALSRVAVAPAAMLAKPSVLTAMATVPQGYAAPYLSEIFEDALGSHGFAPMPVNPAFVSLRTRAISEASGLSSETRSLPDYIARVSVADMAPAAFASNIPGVTIERHEAHAFVELVDRSGRVVFTAHGVNRIEDQVSGETRFAPEQRRDTVVRNALIDAATRLAAFAPQPLRLPIRTVGERMIVTDPAGSLPLGSELVVLRDAGRMTGIEGAVFTPVGRIRTDEITTDGVTASSADVTGISLHGGDVVSLEQAGRPLAIRRAVLPCTDPAGAARLDDRGSVKMNMWLMAATTSFAGRYAGPVYLADLPALLRPHGTEFAGWDKFAPAIARSADSCFTPVVSVAPATDEKGRRRYAVAVGYSMMRGDAKLASGGLQMQLAPTALPAGTAEDVVAAMLQQDLLSAAVPLAERVAAGLATAAP